MLNTSFKLFFSVALVLLLSACAGQLQMKDVESPGPDHSIVFGKFDLIKDGKPQPWHSFWKSRQGIILVLAPGSSMAIKYKVSGEGSFYWGLKPGEYTLLAFEVIEGTDVIGGRVGSTFTVGEETRNIYIGNLKILLEKSTYRVEIEDNYSSEVESFKSRYPNAGDTVKSIISPKTRIGSYSRVRHVCADGWGIECTEEYRGVIPLNPAVGSQAFTTVDSLLPSFKWEPSSVEGTTFDLVVYEAASYSRNGRNTDYMPGRIVLYEEDINGTEFHVNTPLKPGSKYFWSVRLRQNDMVSNWSRFSYFKFYIIGWSSGLGQWFSFETPL